MSAYATALLESPKEFVVEECLRQSDRADTAEKDLRKALHTTKEITFCEQCNTLARCHKVENRDLCGDCIWLCMDKLKTAEARVVELETRIKTVADESYGPLETMTADDAITEIEKGVVRDRAQYNAMRSTVGELEEENELMYAGRKCPSCEYHVTMNVATPESEADND